MLQTLAVDSCFGSGFVWQEDFSFFILLLFFFIFFVQVERLETVNKNSFLYLSFC